MALGPKDIALSIIEIETVSILENIIDTELKSEGGQPDVVLRLELDKLGLSPITRRIERELKSRYLKAGWSNVQFGIGTPGILMQLSWKPE